MGDIRVVVADDEYLSRRRVRQLIDKHGGLTLVGEAADGAEVVEVVRTLRPDLLFLDIQMPEANGFAALEHPEVRSVPAVVFLTAYAQFALRAFSVDAVDYLLKPIREERFRQAIRRVRERLILRRTLEGGREPDRHGVLCLDLPHGQLRVLAEELDWVEASDYYVTLHLEGDDILIREALASLEERLPGDLFIRVHRSAIVNVSRVRSIRGVGPLAEIELKNGTRVPVSRRRKKAVLERFGHLKPAGGS